MKRLSLLIATFLLLVVTIPLVVHAATEPSKSTKNILNQLEQTAGGGVGKTPDQQGPIFPAGDIPIIADRVISTSSSVLGLIFLGMMLYGGYNWLTAMGEEEKVETAKKTITAAFIGLAIIIAAYAVTAYVIGQLYGSK